MRGNDLTFLLVGIAIGVVAGNASCRKQCMKWYATASQLLNKGVKNADL